MSATSSSSRIEPGDAAASRAAANEEAFGRLIAGEPALVDVCPAGEVVPGLTPQMVLTSGAPLAWDEYAGGQRRAIVGGAIHEGLASDEGDADRKIRSGEIELGVCHDHGCVGSVAGITTASMPVLVVENVTSGTRAFCTLFEGTDPARLNYGAYDETVERNLLFLRDTVGPLLRELVRDGGPIPLLPIMKRALQMGDELHSRNAAATLLFVRELTERLLFGARAREADRRFFDYLFASDYFFLRLSMAACKSIMLPLEGTARSTIVTAMAINCRDWAIRVAGLDGWFRAPIPDLEGHFFEGFSQTDVEYIGGESLIAETVGLGGFAQAGAPALQRYQGGSYDGMIEANEAMYRITHGEHPELLLPALGYRGAPSGVDVMRVLSHGVVPVCDVGVAGRDGGQIGAGIMRAPMAAFEAAAAAYDVRYGSAS